MRLLIFTHDLTEANARLMPWRVVCEVVNRLRSPQVTADLVSLGPEGCVYGATKGIPSGTMGIPKERRALQRQLQKLIERSGPDVIFWPVSWREPRWRTAIVGGLGVPVVGYLSGGIYALKSVLRVSLSLGLQTILPYLLEGAAAKRQKLSALKQDGFRQLIALTDLTAHEIRKAGWPSDRIHTIYPGSEAPRVEIERVNLRSEVVEWLKGRPFYLFMGPPSAIRGIYELLKAFDLAAEDHPEITLVCLFRSDAPLESKRIRQRIEHMKHGSRIYAIWESLDRDEVAAFLARCHAVMLPFLIVPSEIPLAIIEALGHRKPVVSTACGGTGDFVARFGCVCPVGDVRALAQAMIRLVEDRKYYDEKCNAAAGVRASYPSWKQVAESWYAAARDASTMT